MISIPTKCFTRFLPQYQHLGDAGADLRAGASAMLMPGQMVIIPTEVKVAIPEGHTGLVMPRSSLSAKGILAFPGVVDSGYRGEIKVTLYNFACMEKFTIQVGNRIAQLLISPVEHAKFFQVPKLPPGDREDNGFGSTGMG